MRITKRIYSGVGYYEVNFGADKVKKSYGNIACLAFARDSSNVAAGHEDGTVSTFHISGLEFVGSKSSNRLRDAISNATLV